MTVSLFTFILKVFWMHCIKIQLYGKPEKMSILVALASLKIKQVYQKHLVILKG